MDEGVDDEVGGEVSEAYGEVVSPRLRRLRREVRERVPGALDGFWRELAEAGAPLVEPVPHAPDERLVTVVWRQERPVAGVYVMVNRVTDKEHASRGMMRRLPGTDLWYVSLRLPRGLRSTYRVHPFGPDDPLLGPEGPRSGSARGLPEDRADPFHHHAAGPFGSTVDLDAAPSLAPWLAAQDSGPRGTAEAFDFAARDGDSYRLRLFVAGVGPDAAEAEWGLLVVCDGEKWFDRYGLTRAVGAAVADGRLPPLAVVGVEAGADPAARMRQLGASRRFVDTLADEMLPAVAARLPGRAARGPVGGTAGGPVVPARTVLCGQSLGGLTALAAALWRPDAFGTVLAHSPSTWWRPGMTARPQTPERGPGADTWLYEQAASAPVSGVTVRMDVGSNEGAMVHDVERLHTVMADRGFDVTRHVYSGGHDFCCWAAALMDGLTGTAVPKWHRPGAPG